MRTATLLSITLLAALLVAAPTAPRARAADEPATEQPAKEQPATDEAVVEQPLAAATFAGLQSRLIGPALMSGRVSDFAVDPHDPSRYYVAVASGGVWKTTNSGTTWAPVFDAQSSYSIGCLAIDPRNPKVVWVGTGENNSQRSVSFGDGVYLTRSDGKTWQNVGLKDSEHIGMIAIDPRDSDVVYVAAQGPLWRSGGDRGLYKTTDGGATWKRVLHISEDTGVNEIHLDPRNPDVMYASSYQRRRRVWTLIDGGPESAIYKSTDGGTTWRQLTEGIPAVDKGRIGLDISPADPDVIYAIIEAAEGKGGFFRSTDRGETWEKRNDYITSSPQYYNEIICDPILVGRVYCLDTFMHMTDDGGKTFARVPRRLRHVDDHALWIDPQNNRHLLVGCDGGVYESFDRAENWQFKANLPITQFYRISADDSKPFYYVYGGTQDNNSQGGPSRTLDQAGITNADWFVTVGGDGYETVVDPTDPNIVYSQWQYGGLVRFDRRSGERVDIKPREAPDEEPYRWNWDSPLILSPHNHTRLYFAANRLFRSNDQGNSWTAISGDLTRRLDRNALEVMGKIQNIDAVAKHHSTSIFGNIVALCEAPRVAGLIYVGTDDGLLQVTDNDGKAWRKIAVFPGVPDRTYISCLTASQTATDTIFAAFDNHKNGDFKPYLLKSTDRGGEWVSIAGDLPDRNIVYSIAEDHEDPDLLFVGTEFGAYFTIDGGTHWIKIAGLPTIAVRDVEIQRRENDLIIGTFGRSIYILDDYTPLRQIAVTLRGRQAVVFPVKDALRYLLRNRLGGRTGRGSQGASYYAAANPRYGAVFTYYLEEKITTRREDRKEAEKKSAKAGTPTAHPTLDQLRREDRQKTPQVFLIVRDDQGQVVRRVAGERDKGIHRVAWDLRYPTTSPVRLQSPSDVPPWEQQPAGLLALPGSYTVTLAREVDGQLTQLTEPVEFNVIPLRLATFAAKDRRAVIAFQKKVAQLQRAVEGALKLANETPGRLAYIRKAVVETPAADAALLAEVDRLEERLRDILISLRGDPTRKKHQQPTPPSISGRVGNIVGSQWHTTAAPTKTERDAYRYAGQEFAKTLADLRSLIEKDLTELEKKLEAAGAPWTPGRIPEWQMD
jgi:photosystem II stability/assembly factor-like uncharacterized protein